MTKYEELLRETEKYEILSEELGHFFTSYGDITNLSDIGNIKQENRARRWSYETTVGIMQFNIIKENMDYIL